MKIEVPPEMLERYDNAQRGVEHIHDPRDPSFWLAIHEKQAAEQELFDCVVAQITTTKRE
jgi:hypothetical protein